MSSPRNRLRVVLRVRQIQEERRQADLARAHAAALAAAEDSRSARERYAAAGVGPTAQVAPRFVADRALAVARAEQVVAAAAQHDLAVGDTERARVLLTEAMTRTSGLERLVERADLARLRERLAADQRAAEESAVAVRELST